MPRDLQLNIMGEFRGLPHDVRKNEMEGYGKLERGKHKLIRFRIGDYRIYFEMNDLGVVVHRILNKNTLRDFFYRSKLPLGEDQALEENPDFWALIDSTKTTE